MKFSKVLRFVREEDAATAVEYAIMLAAIAVAVVKACQVLGGEMNLIFEESHGAIDQARNASN
jgi:Flp pilus assembly pilin Flp